MVRYQYTPASDYDDDDDEPPLNRGRLDDAADAAEAEEAEAEGRRAAAKALALQKLEDREADVAQLFWPRGR